MIQLRRFHRRMATLAHRRETTSCLTSVVIHVAALVFLALLSLGNLGPPRTKRPIVIDSERSEEIAIFSDSDVPLTIAPDGEPQVATTVDVVDEPGIDYILVPDADIRHSAESALDVAKALPDLSIAEHAWLRDPSTLNATLGGHPSGGQKTSARPASAGISAAHDAEQAATAVIQQLRRDLHEGPIYVIWLLDASISLVDDRLRLAETLQPLYEDFNAVRAERPQLMSGVVAYGQEVTQIQDTTKFHENSLAAMQSMSFDESGIENVMNAVEQTVGRFAKRSKGRLRLVVWTDESGDDTAVLERTIKLCRASGTIVHVVGPSSVLGTDRGLQPYMDKATGFRFLLPVVRGPDTCFQERVLLPYWFDQSAGAGVFNGVMVADGVPWYGGAFRERLNSGVGPYALTRLALETGGSFTILDRPGERPAFDLGRMSNYFPDYGDADSIMEEVKVSPLRLAVMRAVETINQPAPPSYPKMRFPTQRMDRYPFHEYPIYVPPIDFRAQLRDVLAQEVASVTQTARRIEQALGNFAAAAVESAYVTEPSLRWRAWFDLTYGRLLVMSVRHQEYLHACRWLAVAGNLDPLTNTITMEPGESALVGDRGVTERAEKGVRLLSRCVQSNPGTPWAMLADWELEHDLGVTVRQGHIPPPPPQPRRPVQPAPIITLPRL